MLSVLLLLLPCAQADDQKFDTLEVGGVIYSNVTVMNKNATHVFITHGKSMASFRVTDLTPEIQRELGYAPPEPPKPKHNPITEPLSQLTEDPEIAEMQAKWQNEASLALAKADPKMLAGVGVGVVLVYLLF